MWPLVDRSTHWCQAAPAGGGAFTSPLVAGSARELLPTTSTGTTTLRRTTSTGTSIKAGFFAASLASSATTSALASVPAPGLATMLSCDAQSAPTVLPVSASNSPTPDDIANGVRGVAWLLPSAYVTLLSLSGDDEQHMEDEEDCEGAASTSWIVARRHELARSDTERVLAHGDMETVVAASSSSCEAGSRVKGITWKAWGESLEPKPEGALPLTVDIAASSSCGDQ
mmetsp:Transcript_29555/g.83310  ORF Transcript_29555/g.83310 Transcript_29555/m.83310 type:complete len:227 (-) Transcript_29555:691-1371(-)